jgi:Spy/CpxP family protein refolding chaperone
MSGRTMLTLGGVAAATFLLASLALAQEWRMGGPGWERGSGPGLMGYWHVPNLTPDQVARMNKFRSEYYNDTAAVRGQILAKHAELKALMTNPNATSEQISAKQREILQLRTQFGEKRIAYEAKLRSVLTKEQLTQMATSDGYGWGRGRGYRRGMGMGPGGMGAGPGVGPGPGYPPGPGFGPGPPPNPEQP